jgi:predicted restriction endonuclease
MQRIFLFLCAFVSLCEVLSLCEVSNIGFSHTKTRRHKDAENIFISLCLCVSV